MMKITRHASRVAPYLWAWLAFAILLPAHADDQDYKAEMDDYINHLPPTARTPDYEKELHDLTSEDPSVAVKIVQKLGLAKDNRSLEMALLHPNPAVQLEAARQLQNAGTDQDIPLLLAAIKEAKSVPAGSANESTTKTLKTELLIALARIEGLDMHDGAVIDETLEKQILEKASKPQ
jgi:hypothetical protein